VRPNSPLLHSGVYFYLFLCSSVLHRSILDTPDALTLSLVFTHLLNEEVCQALQNSTGQDYDEVLAVVHTKPVSSEIRYFFCGIKGYYKSSCPERKAWEMFKKTNEKAALVYESDDDCF